MTKKTKLQLIKRFIKISIIVCVLFTFIVLGFFIKPSHTFENSSMKKWSKLTRKQQIETIEHVVKDSENQDLLLNCVSKIAALPKSNEMQIRDATVLCYNGIKLNSTSGDEK